MPACATKNSARPSGEGVRVQPLHGDAAERLARGGRDADQGPEPDDRGLEPVEQEQTKASQPQNSHAGERQQVGGEENDCRWREQGRRRWPAAAHHSRLPHAHRPLRRRRILGPGAATRMMACCGGATPPSASRPCRARFLRPVPSRCSGAAAGVRCRPGSPGRLSSFSGVAPVQLSTVNRYASATLKRSSRNSRPVEVLLQNGKARVGKAERVGLCLGGRRGGEQRHVDALVQLGADEAQPLAAAVRARCRSSAQAAPAGIARPRTAESRRFLSALRHRRCAAPAPCRAG